MNKLYLSVPYWKLVFFLVILFPSKFFGQPKNTLINDVILPAPNATSLGKYGDIPVSYFTGVPNVSIPIFTIQEGPLSLPISISYHSAGVKIAEIASWVGLGWSLNAGGMITRTVLGRPDDVQFGYLDNGASLEPPLQAGNNTATMQAEDISNGELDSEPDIFNLNVGSLSLKFSFDKNGIIYLFPKQDVIITYKRSTIIYQWLVITPDGTRYTFGRIDGESLDTGLEYTIPDGMLNSDKSPSSYYLRKIETHDQKHAILFDYVQDYYSYYSLSSCSVNWSSVGSISEVVQCGGIAAGANFYILKTVIEGKKLSSIRSSTYKADFISTTTRLDIDPYTPEGQNSTQLDRIEIKQTANPTICYKKFAFNYNYIQSPNDPGKSEYKRLRLISMQETSCETTPTIIIPAHTFEYDLGTLENRLSRGVDHWGFFNNQTGNNSTLNIPSSPAIIPGGTLSPPSFTANRNANPTVAQNGILKKINYPTGGNTQFTYESNEISNPVNSPGSDIIFTMTNCTVLNSTCCSNNFVNPAPVTFSPSQINSSTQFSVTSVNLLAPTAICSGNFAPQPFIRM